MAAWADRLRPGRALDRLGDVRRPAGESTAGAPPGPVRSGRVANVSSDTCELYNGHMNEVALLAEQVGVNERTLRRAVNEGTLRATRPSPRKLKLSSSERQYVRRSWSLLSALRAALRTEPNVRFALLFGSAAAGTDTSARDLDVLVDLRDPSLEHVADLSAKLTAKLGRHVDVLRLSDAQAQPAFLADVLTEGRVLVDRAERWALLRRGQISLQRRAREDDSRRARAALAGIDRLLAS